ncbi:MAG: TerC/Alx family metal homeostasis membrane protein [Candidatus Cyclobacteriaceae bacterium M3_2C_046]
MILNLTNITTHLPLLLVFGLVIVLFLIIDLGFLNKTAKKVTTRSAFNQTLFWIGISLIFGILIYFFDGGTDATMEYFSAYITEKALSIDNIFVIILIFKFFKVEEKHYHHILFWGILGAVIFRAFFIFAGAYLVHEFHWILYIFGAFLVYSGVKILYQKADEQPHPERNPVLRLAKKVLNVSLDDRGGKFMFVSNKKLYFTPLFLVVILIETTDLIFAVDSIPAAFAITQNEFVIYTSNIFAILGLRAMFFLLVGVIDRFHFLQKALSMILIFIGAKMLLDFFGIEIPVVVSFVVIIISLTFSVILSILIPQQKEEEKPLELSDLSNKPSESAVKQHFSPVPEVEEI